MLNKLKSLIIFLIIATFLAGCSAKAVKDESPGPKTTTKKGFFTWSPSDTDLLGEALACLNNKETAPDYNTAKEKLELLLKQYPKSKWAGGAQGLIQGIDTIMTLQAKVKQASADNAKISKENEQLKNDIALLKKLEIQLEKREKMLK